MHQVQLSVQNSNKVTAGYPLCRKLLIFDAFAVIIQTSAQVQAEEVEEEEEEEVSAGLFSFGTRRIKARAQQEGRTTEVAANQVRPDLQA